MATSTRFLRGWIVLYSAAVYVFIAGIVVIVLQIGFDKPTVSEVFPQGELRIGVDASYAPLAFSTSDGLAGLEIDLGTRIAEEIGLTPRFINIGFDSLYDSLIGEPALVDVVISQLLITPSRTGSVFYTTPYVNSGLVLVVPSESDIQTMRDLSGYSLAYEFGSSADNESRKWLRRIPEYDIRPYELSRYALDAVRLGDADAALVDFVTARLYFRDYPEWSATYYEVTDALYAIAVNIHQVDRWQLINRTLNELIADDYVRELLDKWL
ncbi:MAG: ABC transporter substrate-binding protein [Aggregatilineales bacterium]